MEDRIYREGAVDRLSSPENMNQYVRVTRPALWVTLAAVILLIAGCLIWMSMTYISSFLTGTADVRNGIMTVTLDNDQKAENLETGMTVTVGDTKSVINSVGKDGAGRCIATAETTLFDGSYPARVSYRETQLISLLFN